MFTAPMHLDVLAAVHYLRQNGAKTVAVMGGSFGGGAAADASIASQPGEINCLILLAGEGNGSAERIQAPLLEIALHGMTRVRTGHGCPIFVPGSTKRRSPRN